jgi:3',5'-nucleoside bisphosphate phosphatase
MIDLHSHTTASDGEHSPEDLLTRARVAGVTTLAVTDHDTVKGLARAQVAADARGVRLVPGIEVSTEAEGREVHVLGHFVDPTEPGLASFSDRLGTERAERMGRMVERMNQLGFPVTFEEVERIAAGAHLGRPHLALALLGRGYVTSTREAFDRFIGDGKPGWVDRFRLPAEDAIAMLHLAGGTATIAHPGSSKVSSFTLERLTKAGLDGLEIFHPDHVPSQREAFLRQADALGLVPTAGSDYHGPRVTPDRSLGMVSLDPKYFARLEERASARAPRR